MTHTYKISGMTCGGCQAKVKDLLSQTDGVNTVNIDLSKGEASIEMSSHIKTETLKEALKDYPKYQLSDMAVSLPFIAEEKRSWLETYKPVLLIFSFITGITLLIEWNSGNFNWMEWMHYFMAGFFIVFSFFKLLNLQGFAESYSMYDIIAKKWKGWGYVYAFTELALGLAFLVNFMPVAANTITFIVMSVSLVGVVQSVMNKQRIKCACLGDVFNLPMSTITIIEDSLMIAMSIVMIFAIV